MTEKSNNSPQFLFTCPLSSGLHARPASHLADVANQFRSECRLTNLRNNLIVNGKSVLGIISADIRQGDRCSLCVSGPDESAAHAALRRFVEESLPHGDVPLAGIVEADRTAKPSRVLQAANVPCIFGVSVSRGIGQGKVVMLQRMTLPASAAQPTAHDLQREQDLIRAAVLAVRGRIGEKIKYSITPTGTAVLQADLAMAGDVLLLEKLTEQILLGKSAAQAVVEASKFFMDLLGHSENEYIRQRAADIEEICLQLLEEVCGTGPATSAVELSEPSVLVAETLAPQQLLQLDRRCLQAIVLEHSAATSHAAILARSLGIPMITSVRNARVALTSEREVVVDANRGFVIPEISPAVRRFYDREHTALAQRAAARSREADRSEAAAEGSTIEVGANASSGEELALAFANGADGIGLFRTEMLLMGREQAPSEQEQTAVYTEAARLARGNPVIIRTFDVGGDKNVPYLNLPKEDNPFLGYRGARIYADHRGLLQSQLRAILRASIAGNIWIMAPMISSLEEVLHFKTELSRAKQDLKQEGVRFQPELKIGIMVEVPSVAFMLDELCAEIDFFSVGTNDLSQYFFAADRGNGRVPAFFTVRHPAFLRFLRQVVQQIRRSGKWVGMCGEMAADACNLPLLVGLGLDEISVPAAEVHTFKANVAGLRPSDCGEMLDRALACGKTAEVDALLATRTTEGSLQPLLSADLVLLGSSSQTKEEVIQEMVDAFYISSRTEDRQLLEEALWARETMGSTGLGYGFAIPHCKTDAVAANSICVLRLQEPINWDSIHGEPVRLVVLLALRDSEVGNTHMQVFSSLARRLMNEDFRHTLLNIGTAGEVTAYLADQLGIPLGTSNGTAVESGTQ